MGNDHSSEKKKGNSSSSSSSSSSAPKVEIPPGAEIIGSYLIEQILGKGSFAEVKLGQNIHTGDKAALKLISKQNLNKGKRKIHLQREIRFMKLLSHPHIAILYDVIEREDSYVLIMEHAGGGELLEYIRNADKHRINEREARRLFRQIVSAVDYCHKNNLIHRDLKPENVLLDDHTDVKIIDFGFSREFTGDMQLDSFIGSPHYAAPELLQGIKYSGPEVDIWSLGILLYVMICGKQPFKHPDMKILYSKITKGDFEYPEWVSSSARDLINSILQVDPKKRCSMEQIKNHKWMLEGFDGPPNTYLEPRPHLKDLDPDIVEELLKYGFEREELERTLLKNEPVPVLNFYHLLAERKRQTSRDSTDMETEHSSQEGDEQMVTRVETDERIPISSVEKNLRRQIIRRQSNQNEVLKRGSGQQGVEPMVE